MKQVFADTLYWIAMTRPNDPWTKPARDACAALGEIEIVTTDEVLSEFLAALSAGSAAVRRAAVEIVQKLLASSTVHVMPQSRDSFLRALNRYGMRSDKHYSLTDCSSMNAMDDAGIRDVLTNDHHFEQEGYNILIK